MARLQRLFLIRDYTIIFHSKTKKKKMWIGYWLMFFFFFGEKNTHTQGREKWILTQKHTTTPLKSHGAVGQC